MKYPHLFRRIPAILLILILTACGGGGGGGGGGGSFRLDGGPVNGSFDPASPNPSIYSFNVTAGVPYTVAMVNTSGDTALYLYTENPMVNPSATLIGISWVDGNYEAVSFIASYTGAVYAFPIGFSTGATSYTIEATTNHLAVNAAPRSDNLYGGGIFGSDLFYSFDAQAGNSYEVRVSPSVGNVDVGAVSLNTDMSASVGSSSNAGTATDSVFFTASATQRYYIRVDGTNVDSTFEIRVLAVPAGPDLTVTIDSAVSDGTNVIVDYTVTNNGADAYNGNVDVDVWSDAVSPPMVGMVGEDTITHSAVSVAGLGGTFGGQAIIANTAENGTAYAVVDTLEAVVEGNESNNVSSGVSWQKPLLVPVSFDFESATIPGKFIMSGSANWAIDGTTGGSGSATSLRSGSIGDSQSSCFSFSVYHTQGVSISFDRMVSSESWDELRFYIDNVQTGTWAGTVAWGNVNYTASSGLHEYKWCYVKDFSISSGSDASWVDNITIVTEPTDLSVSITSTSSDGANVTINYTVYNNTSVPSGAFDVDFWSDALSAPAVGDIGEASANHTSIAAWSSTSSSIVIANAAGSGTAYAVVDTANAVSETNEANNVSSGSAWVVMYPDLTVTINDVLADGTDVTVFYTVTNSGTGDAAAFDVDFWADALSAPAVGDAGDVAVAYTGLTSGSSIIDSVVISSTVTSGTSYAVVDTAAAINESNESNNVSAGVALSAAIVTYDIESGTVPAGWVGSGDLAWTADTAEGAGGSTNSLVSGAITHSQTSCTAVTVNSSTGASFSYRVSSESSFDYLRFYIDGGLQSSWSGQLGWNNASFSVASGNHEYKWCYEKDSSVNSYSDAVWIDNIVIF